jgi:hypothetical protein
MRMDRRTASRKAASRFHQVPTIGDLDGVRQRFCDSLAIATTAVSRYDFDLRMVGKPSLNGCDLTIRQERHDLPPLQIANDCSVAMVPPEGSVINAGNG